MSRYRRSYSALFRGASSRGRGFLAFIAKSAVGVLVTVLVFELIVFRFLLRAPDVPANAFVEGVIKFEPRQEGVAWRRDGTGAAYRINAQGWNSGHPEYRETRRPGVSRVAVIGDSYVDAQQVDFDQSLAEELERLLGPRHWEVYRFGIGAAPLSQHLHVLRREAVRYRPDHVVFVLIHNDFDESYNIELGRYPTSFLRLRFAPAGIEEIAPEPYRRPWYHPIRASASYRFLVDRQGLDIQRLKDFVNRRRFAESYQANVRVDDLDERMDLDRAATGYVFARLGELAERHGFEPLLAMDGDREAIYAGRSTAGSGAEGALRLNRMAAEVAARHGIPFLDLHPVFEADYRRHRRRFNSPTDGHWNEYGHEVAARALYGRLAGARAEARAVD